MSTLNQMLDMLRANPERDDLADAIVELFGSKKHHEKSKGSRTTWQTPPWLIDRINAVWPIVFDPATSHTSPWLPRYWVSPTHESLPPGMNRDTPWADVVRSTEGGAGVAFLNPPYGRKLMEPFFERVQDTPTVMLLPVRPSTKWWADYVEPHHKMFLRKRVAFVNPDTGAPQRGTGFDSVLVLANLDPEPYTVLSDIAY